MELSMSPYAFIFSFLTSGISGPVSGALVIILATFILEDATTVSVGVLAADHVISVPFALFSVAVGIAIGDLFLYTVGRLAVRYSRIRAFIQNDKVLFVGTWINERLWPTIIGTRFLPGLRIPVYLACGFFEVPLSRFILPVIGGALIWSSFLFTLSYLFGIYTLAWLGLWRWPIIAVAVVAFLLIGRAHWKRILAEDAAKQALPEAEA